MKEVISGSEMEPEKRDSERREEQQQQQENQRAVLVRPPRVVRRRRRRRVICAICVRTGAYSSWISYQSQSQSQLSARSEYE